MYHGDLAFDVCVKDKAWENGEHWRYAVFIHAKTFHH